MLLKQVAGAGIANPFERSRQPQYPGGRYATQGRIVLQHIRARGAERHPLAEAFGDKETRTAGRPQRVDVNSPVRLRLSRKVGIIRDRGVAGINQYHKSTNCFKSRAAG